MKLVFKVDGRLPGLNELINEARKNRYSSASLKKTAQRPLELVFRRQSCGRKVGKHALVNVRFYEPFNKKYRRDDDNIFAGLKFIMDAFTAVGVIADDNPKYVHVKPERIKDCEKPRIEIDIEEDDVK